MLYQKNFPIFAIACGVKQTPVEPSTVELINHPTCSFFIFTRWCVRKFPYGTKIQPGQICYGYLGLINTCVSLTYTYINLTYTFHWLYAVPVEVIFTLGATTITEGLPAFRKCTIPWYASLKTTFRIV